ncbi:MAG: transcriptional regulator [Bdellovibrionaceae bacterium]|nr:transcriptional regulator [Bdellovibrio sp.]
MKLINFKLVTIICEPVLSSRILALSHELGATGFTMTEVRGQGNGEKSSGEIPDSKIKIEIVMAPDVAVHLMNLMSETYFENYSIITYLAEISVLRSEKFDSEKT